MLPHWTPYLIRVPVTVTTGAYTAGDVVGGTLSCDVPQLKGGGYLQAVRLVDDEAQAEPYKLWVFDAAPSTIANDAPHAPTEADYLKCVGVIDIPATAYRTDGSEADCAFAAGIDEKTEREVFFANLSDGKLYFRLVAVETPDYADANDLTLHVCVLLM
jgi:hypothetical protein